MFEGKNVVLCHKKGFKLYFTCSLLSCRSKLNWLHSRYWVYTTAPRGRWSQESNHVKSCSFVWTVWQQMNSKQCIPTSYPSSKCLNTFAQHQPTSRLCELRPKHASTASSTQVHVVWSSHLKEFETLHGNSTMSSGAGWKYYWFKSKSYPSCQIMGTWCNKGEIRMSVLRSFSISDLPPEIWKPSEWYSLQFYWSIIQFKSALG